MIYDRLRRPENHTRRSPGHRARYRAGAPEATASERLAISRSTGCMTHLRPRAADLDARRWILRGRRPLTRGAEDVYQTIEDLSHVEWPLA
jgi:hypothetical protein